MTEKAIQTSDSNAVVSQATGNSDFFQEVLDILNHAREYAQTAINLSMVYAYYEIGKRIFEMEQQGKNRADYGKQLINGLSDYLTVNYGKGYSISNLKNIRQFYRVFAEDQIGQTVFSQFKNFPATQAERQFYLSWSHYLFLMRIDNIDERHFYEIEAVCQGTGSVTTFAYFCHFCQ